MRPARFTRKLMLGLVGISLATGTTASASDPNSPLNKSQVQLELNRQKMEAEVATAIVDASKLPTRERAIAALKAKKMALAADVSVPTQQLSPILDKLNAKIALLEDQNAKPSILISEETLKIRQKEEQRLQAIQAEYKEVNRSLDTISALVEAKKLEQARKEADALYAKYPTNPISLALREKTAIEHNLTEARQLQKMASDGYLMTMRSVTKSAVPINGEIEYDKDYTKLIAKLRNPNPLTEKERRTIRALDTEVIFNVKDKSLEDTLKELENRLGTPIILDEFARKELNIDSSSTVSLNLQNVTNRTVLKKILQDKGLSFVLKNETIIVTTAEKAKDMLVSRVYYIGDLVTAPMPGTIGRGYPAGDMRLIQENVDRLMDGILKIDPMSWEKNAGTGHGTISFHIGSMSFIIRQSAEVHAKIANSISR